MKEIGEYLLQREEKRIESTPSSQWTDLVGRFTDSYNREIDIEIKDIEDRLKKLRGYRMSYDRMAVKLSILNKVNGLNWLEWFYQDCKKQANFGRYFNYQISTKGTNHGTNNFTKSST